MSSDIFLLFLFSSATFLSRIVDLLAIPIFTDEAIYIRWAQIGLADPAHRYLSLTDGKQPLFIWLMYPALQFFSHPLFAGRFVSVLAGVGSCIGIYLTSRTLFFRKRTASIASLFYLFSPFSFVYDRLALMDSLLALFAIWSLYLSILFVRTLQLDVSLLLGVVIGLGLLTKSSAFFFLYLLPFSLLLFSWNRKHVFRDFLRWIGYSVLVTFIAQIMYNSLRLSPFFYIIEQKNYSFIFTFDEFFRHPFSVFLPNLNGLTDMLVGYLTFPVAVVVLAGAVFGVIRRDRRVVFLLLWFILPFLSLALMGKVLFPRFLLFMVLPLFLVAAYAVEELVLLFRLPRRLQRRYVVLLVIGILAYPFSQVFLLVVSPPLAHIPVIDRNQLFDDWPSGYGVNDVISFLEQESRRGKVVIGTEGTFGLFPAAFEIFLGRNPNVEIHGYWPVSEVPHELIEKSALYPTYLVFKEKQNIPEHWPLRLVAKYRRGSGSTHLLFYRVLGDIADVE